MLFWSWQGEQGSPTPSQAGRVVAGLPSETRAPTGTVTERGQAQAQMEPCRSRPQQSADAVPSPLFSSPIDLVSFLALLHKNLDLDLLLSTYTSAIGCFVPAAAAAMYLLDPATSRPIKMAAQGADPKFLSAYELRGRDCDPVFSRVSSKLQPTCSRMVLSERAWQSHPFHRVLSLGSLDRILEAPIVHPEKGLVGTLNFGRAASDRHFDDDELATIDRIAQHVSIAVRHAYELNELRDREMMVDVIFQALGTGVMLTDTCGNVQFLNLAARRLFEECEANPALKSVMATGLSENLAGLGESGRATRCLRLPCRCLNRSAYITAHSVRIACSQELVATFWYLPGQNPNFEHLGSVLTAHEIRVLELLAQGLENKQIAEYLTVSIDTVKSHLKRIFAKMHVASRAQLLSQLFYQS